MRITRDFKPMSDRYGFDFGPCSTANGFAQIDTRQDASTVDHAGRLLDCAAYKLGDYESYIGLNEHDTHPRVIAMFDHALDMARAATARSTEAP